MIERLLCEWRVPGWMEPALPYLQVAALAFALVLILLARLAHAVFHGEKA